ncbi:uncharacterized protein LOC112128042 [Cimex lectularius]|uniref:Uncharacterized protein n=1 Tax=Cimex lectularius TaxID=79782 RepID=A0A8I6SPQ5_CIMLE|nr:uncharacterized protein LOC112128042 [Cimex lectularius]
MAIVMSSRSKLVVGGIIVTFLVAAVLVVGSTAGWFHKHQPMPAPHPLQHSHAKVIFKHFQIGKSSHKICFCPSDEDPEMTTLKKRDYHGFGTRPGLIPEPLNYTGSFL